MSKLRLASFLIPLMVAAVSLVNVLEVDLPYFYSEPLKAAKGNGTTSLQIASKSVSAVQVSTTKDRTSPESTDLAATEPVTVSPLLAATKNSKTSPEADTTQAASQHQSIATKANNDDNKDVLGTRRRDQERQVQNISKITLSASTAVLNTTAAPARSTSTPQSCFKANTEHTLSLLKTYNYSTSAFIPKPILNMGFPKSGSTTLQRFLVCAGMSSRHQGCGRTAGQCGVCMRKAAFEDGLPPLQTCGNAQGYTQMDFSFPRNDACYFPQIEMINEFHKEAPNATFVLLFRSMDKWIQSISNWSTMRGRLTNCNITGFPRGMGKTNKEMEQWFCDQVTRVRNFVQQHPSHALIEIDIESDSAGHIMDALFHADIINNPRQKNVTSCWGHHNVNSGGQKCNRCDESGNEIALAST